ncbi:MAG: Transcriptional regulator [Pelotomaculum thermopropionicum]|uniref:siroheme decarboxylase n=1 Tax=Pelotomaculum thermopropionicum TaxID=110500 RepID=A0A101HRF4_9FIRM|nr:MAG: Transcriptional regulator [Pelotomaculum thermopropionicum]
MKPDPVDNKLINLIQSNFPLVPEPYREIGAILGIGEDEVMDRIKRLRENGVLRRLGGIFDSRKLGYAGTLCAIKVPEGRIDETAAVINSYSGVTHNYIREHRFNMWFTVLAPSQDELDEIIKQIKSRTGINDIMVLPAEKIFKIRVNFDLD